jgi:AraC-like DNA-binding protein
MREVQIALGEPPRVANIGIGVHGVRARQEVFLLPDLWQFHLYTYTGTLSLEGTSHPIHPGYVSLVPPGTEVRFDYRGRSEHVYVHLAIAHRGGDTVTVPVMQDAGGQLPTLSTLLHGALAATPAEPAKAAALVWAALWRATDLQSRRPSGQRHRVVAAAMAHIEEHLSDPLSVPEIARAAGISHGQLTRLFRAETGDTVVAYIRQRRMDHARHLLEASTMPILAIATAVGIPDLQAFNKTCRRVWGRSPRAVRSGS